MKFPWVKRNDLIIQPHDTGGWLIKDPVTLQFTLLSAVEYGVFQKMDGQVEAASLLDSGKDGKYTIEDLQNFLSHLIKRQLLFRSAGGDSERLAAKPVAKASALTWMTRLLSWYVPLGNPQRLLNRLQWVSSIATSRLFVRLCTFIFVAAAVVLALNLGQVVTAVSELARHFTAGTAITMLVIVVGVKLAHELGHALSARYYGAECHEAGILFLFLTPVPFTNVTDSWKLPVRQRMMVTGAGMLIELLIASVCMILWSISADGTTRILLLQTALICSLNTILFNGNPLLKFDGYFLLSDFLRIPNLSSRSFDVLRSSLISFVVGRSDDRASEVERRKTLLGYAVMAGVYRVFLAFSILEAIHFLCSSHDLELFGWFLKVFAIGMLLGVPILKTLIAFAVSSTSQDLSAQRSSFLTENSQSLQAGPRFQRVVRAILVMAAIVFVCFLPLPSSVVSLATVTPSEHIVFAEVSGQLTTVDDDRASNGRVANSAWRLTKAESETAIQHLQAEFELAEVRLQIAMRSPSAEKEMSRTELQQLADGARQRLQEATVAIRRQSQPMKSRESNFVSGRRFSEDVDGQFDEDWSGQPLSKQNLGAWIQQGTTLGYLRDSPETYVTAWVAQRMVQKIVPDQSARFRLDAGDAVFHDAKVVAVSRFPAEILPDNIAVLGEIVGDYSELGFRPDDVIYSVTIRLAQTESGKNLPINGVGRASIRVESISLVSRFYDYLRRTFVFTGRSWGL